MYAINTYQTLEDEIEICRFRIEQWEREKKIYLKQSTGPKEIGSPSYDGMPKGNKIEMTFDRVLIRIGMLDMKIQDEQEILQDKLDIKLAILNKIKGLTDMQYKVAHMKEIEGLNNIQIAMRLNIGEATVYRILKRVREKS